MIKSVPKEITNERGNTMAYCKYCDSNIEGDLQICPNCAAPLPETKKETKNGTNTQVNSGTYTYTYTYTQTSSGGNVPPANANMYYQNSMRTMQNPKRPSDALAIVSLVFGIISLTTFCCLGGFLGIIGLVLGIIALTDNQCNRKALAIAGTIISAVMLLLTIAVFLLG